MKSIVLKLLCVLAGMFGLLIIAFSVYVYNLGYLNDLSSSVAALKLGGTAIRAALLILCAWAAWKYPRHVVYYASGAMFAFIISGALDEVLKHGFADGFGNLMATYYFVVASHAVFSMVVWYLGKDISIKVGNG